MYSWFDAKTLIYNKIDNFCVELNRFSYSSDYVPKGLANKLKKELCISMQDWDFILEEYIDLPFELDEAVKKNLQRFIHAQDSGGYYGTGTYVEALQEVKNGHKSGHWIWYVFPQMKGLGK